MTFRVGQKVACLIEPSDKIKREYPGAVWPVKDGVYTIRSMFQFKGKTLLRFLELDNSGSTWNGIERGFHSKYFAPIVSRKTDISALKALLVPGAKIRETA
jgi:hypothetical protein